MKPEVLSHFSAATVALAATSKPSMQDSKVACIKVREQSDGNRVFCLRRERWTLHPGRHATFGLQKNQLLPVTLTEAGMCSDGMSPSINLFTNQLIHLSITSFSASSRCSPNLVLLLA